MSSVADTKRRDWEDQEVYLRSLLARCEWVYDTGIGVRMCPECEGEHPDHHDTCELAAVLAVKLEQVQTNRVLALHRVDADVEAQEPVDVRQLELVSVPRTAGG